MKSPGWCGAQAIIRIVFLPIVAPVRMLMGASSTEGSKEMDTATVPEASSYGESPEGGIAEKKNKQPKKDKEKDDDKKEKKAKKEKKEKDKHKDKEKQEESDSE
eukprot:18868-Prorocentrum_minimum.AAC.1